MRAPLSTPAMHSYAGRAPVSRGPATGVTSPGDSRIKHSGPQVEARSCPTGRVTRQRAAFRAVVDPARKRLESFVRGMLLNITYASPEPSSHACNCASSASV